MTARKLVITLDGERAVSWNKFYAGKHWAKRKALADDMHMLVRAALDPNEPPFDQPVHITIVSGRKVSNHAIDADNVCDKILIDGLHGFVIVDDTPEFVRHVNTWSHHNPAGDYIRIIVEECHCTLPGE